MKSTYETVYLPLEEAIKAAARQNYETDLANEVFDQGEDTDWDSVKGEYLEEAEAVLKQTGENYKPELKGYPLVKVFT